MIDIRWSGNKIKLIAVKWILILHGTRVDVEKSVATTTAGQKMLHFNNIDFRSRFSVPRVKHSNRNIGFSINFSAQFASPKRRELCFVNVILFPVARGKGLMLSAEMVPPIFRSHIVFIAGGRIRLDSLV